MSCYMMQMQFITIELQGDAEGYFKSNAFMCQTDRYFNGGLISYVFNFHIFDYVIILVDVGGRTNFIRSGNMMKLLGGLERVCVYNPGTRVFAHQYPNGNGRELDQQK